MIYFLSLISSILHSSILHSSDLLFKKIAIAKGLEYWCICKIKNNITWDMDCIEFIDEFIKNIIFLLKYGLFFSNPLAEGSYFFCESFRRDDYFVLIKELELPFITKHKIYFITYYTPWISGWINIHWLGIPILTLSDIYLIHADAAVLVGVDKIYKKAYNLLSRREFNLMIRKENINLKSEEEVMKFIKFYLFKIYTFKESHPNKEDEIWGALKRGNWEVICGLKRGSRDIDYDIDYEDMEVEYYFKLLNNINDIEEVKRFKKCLEVKEGIKYFLDEKEKEVIEYLAECRSWEFLLKIFEAFRENVYEKYKNKTLSPIIKKEKNYYIVDFYLWISPRCVLDVHIEEHYLFRGILSKLTFRLKDNGEILEIKREILEDTKSLERDY